MSKTKNQNKETWGIIKYSLFHYDLKAQYYFFEKQNDRKRHTESES